MDLKLVVLVLAASLLFDNPVVADFFFNHPLPKPGHLHHGMKCVPGRTIMKVTERQSQNLNTGDSNSDEFRLRSGDSRRTHMTVPTKDEYCRMCVCSADGKDEYCSNRPAENVNECLMLAAVMDDYHTGIPFEHTRALTNRIRRDYLWHNDEIPYDTKAKCYRGHSYYSNSLSANNTDIDIGSDIDSLLNYANDNTCFFCICAVDGSAAGCIHRDVQYCNFFRVIRDDKAIRDRYTALFEQDRPTYFRQLSWRMRRTMDSGIYDLITNGMRLGGDTLCCNHPDGHRRQIHNDVRNKLRALKKRLPKENLLGGSMRGDYVDFIVNNDSNSLSQPSERKCVPFVSEYSTCNDDNMCTGCTKCTCTSQAQWSCEDVKLCEDDLNNEDEKIMDQDEIFDNALDILEHEVRGKKQRPPAQISTHSFVPDPPKLKKDNGLLDGVKDYKMEDLLTAIVRPKRSTNDHKAAAKPDKKNNKHSKRSIEKVVKGTNNTVKFYETVDELNEDTLKNSSASGTLTAIKMDMIPKLAIMRRSGDADAANTSKALHIEYNQPKVYNPITDNKIDAADHDTKFDASHENLRAVLGNHSQVLKDKELSKIVVNELKSGSEIIGDAQAPVTSNITFTPENDTLTAMAFIAGNLLNKLWNMEKDASGSSAETDVVKHEKLTDLLDLFKEPLNLRQETFLKNALQQLSSAMDKNKDISNISICENIEEAKRMLFNMSDSGEQKYQLRSQAPCSKGKEDPNQATVKAISKINNVLDLIRKFENIQGHLSTLKHGPKLNFNRTEEEKMISKNEALSKDETHALSLFGKILEKVTKLLIPRRNNKKISNHIRSQNMYADDDNVKTKFKKLYNIDLSNMTVSAKDKLVLDYLTHIDGNPDCLLNIKNRGTKTLPNVEGNILLNLSEFFKMKSFNDLIKLIEPETHLVLRSPTEQPTTKLYDESTTVVEDQTVKANSKAEVDAIKFNSTKEKLKAHLKTIIEDLIELQNAKGINVKGNIRIADALPCIYNIINAGREQPTFPKDNDNTDAAKRITEIFNTLKKEMKSSSFRRNNNNLRIPKERPKSAVVWERLLNNLNEKAKAKTRRMSDFKSAKSYDEIRELMDRLENSSSTYKRNALLYDVPPSGKLMMLKTLEQDVTKSIKILEDIKLAYPTLSKLPSDKFFELEEFVKNVATSINLNEKVTEKVKDKPDPQKLFANEINSGDRLLKSKPKRKPILRYNDVSDEEQLKVSRTQIVSQLIRNRMNLYLKMKDDKEFDVNNDMSYNIAKRVLYYLNAGNYDLAKEMFKVFVMQKKDKFGIALSNDQPLDQFITSSTPKTMIKDVPFRRMGSPEKQPILQFGERTKLTPEVNWVNQDHLIKQLLNIKNMGM